LKAAVVPHIRGVKLKTVPKPAGLAAVGVLLAAGALAACGGHPGSSADAAALAQVQKCQPGMPMVTVQGFGSATGRPDQLTISLEVQTNAPTARASMAANAAKASAVVSKLEADGVTADDLQTSGLSVQPNYNSSGTVITGYQVTNGITVTVNFAGSAARAGTLIDDAASVAGNAVRVNGISFSLIDQSALLAAARTGAVKQAAAQAETLAKASGMLLGPLCSLHDNTQQSQPPVPFAMAAAAAAPATTPVEAGTLQVSANVTAVYQLSEAPAPAASAS
jgi:uncharacterized protein YggE